MSQMLSVKSTEQCATKQSAVSPTPQNMPTWLDASHAARLQMWDSSLDLVTSVRAAHGGGKVHALVVGPDGVIYTGGDDKVCLVLFHLLLRRGFQ